MTSEQIQNERREDYKLLARFLGLAEMAGLDDISPDRLHKRMAELWHEYRRPFECEHGKRLDDRLGCAQCDETVGEVRQSV